MAVRVQSSGFRNCKQKQKKMEFPRGRTKSRTVLPPLTLVRKATNNNKLVPVNSPCHHSSINNPLNRGVAGSVERV